MGTYSANPTSLKEAKLRGFTGEKYATISSKDGHVTVIDRKINTSGGKGWKGDSIDPLPYVKGDKFMTKIPKGSDIGGVADWSAAQEYKISPDYDPSGAGTGSGGWRKAEESNDKTILIAGALVVLALIL